MSSFIVVNSQQGKTALIKIVRTAEQIGIMKIFEYNFESFVLGMDVSETSVGLFINHLTVSGLKQHYLE